MGTGLGIFLLAAGAILSFAVSDRISGVNLATVGYILMGAGVLALIMAVVTNAQRNKSEQIIEHRQVPPTDNRQV